MENFRYGLAKQGKSVCPACKQKRFVLYIDNETGKPLHSTVGKCDRADNCGYHYTPKQYFTENNIPFDKREYVQSVKNFTPKPPNPSYIDAGIFRKSLQGYEGNSFVRFLRRRLGNEATEKAVERYRIGTAKNGGAVFWEIDRNGQIHAGKIIQYGTDGHRLKDIEPPVGWVHTVLKLPSFHLSQCFFGEHLLTDTTKPVAIVESEKTAVVASHYYPNIIWLACGGKDGINIDRFRRLQGCNIVLFPDVGMYDYWRKKAERLRAICQIIVVSDLIEKNAIDKGLKKGDDLADYLLKYALSDVPKASNEATIEANEANERKDYETLKSDNSCFLEKKTADLRLFEDVKNEKKNGNHRFNSPDWERSMIIQGKKKKIAFVSDAGSLYVPVPTPAGMEGTYAAVYTNIDAYNLRLELPEYVTVPSSNILVMKKVFIDVDTLII